MTHIYSSINWQINNKYNFMIGRNHHSQEKLRFYFPFLRSIVTGDYDQQRKSQTRVLFELINKRVEFTANHCCPLDILFHGDRFYTTYINQHSYFNIIPSSSISLDSLIKVRWFMVYGDLLDRHSRPPLFEGTRESYISV